MRQSPLRIVAGTLLAAMLCSLPRAQADVKPGDVITKDNASKVADLLSPGNYVLVREGMQLRIVPTDKLDWPPPFRAATEKYSPQVQLGPDGTLKGYVCRAAVSAGRSERSASGDQGDVEFQLPAALQRRYRYALSRGCHLRQERHRLAAELLHGGAFRVLQQYRPHRGASDTDRSRRRSQRHSLPLRLLSVHGTVVVARLRDGAAAAYRSHDRGQRMGVQSRHAQAAP